MMKKILLLFLLLLGVASVFSQSAIVVRFGVGYDYYWGKDQTSYDEFEYDASRAIPNLEAMIGLRSISNPKDSSKHIIGVFGRAGFLSKTLLKQYVVDQGLSFSIDSTRSSGDFQELEFGLLLMGKIRLSAGYGWMNFHDEEHKPVELNYFSGTVGLSIPISRISWNINCTVINGKDFKQTVFRPSTSIVFTID